LLAKENRKSKLRSNKEEIKLLNQLAIVYEPAAQASATLQKPDLTAVEGRLIVESLRRAYKEKIFFNFEISKKASPLHN